MKFNFKKSLCICASALMMLSMAAPAVNASTTHGHVTNVKVQRELHHVNTHQANEAKVNHIKQLHLHNVERYNRIKRHILSHQKNLQRIAKKLSRAKNQPRKHNAKYVAMINRWNGDKARLIHSIETNERGMVRLAERVNNERHEIDLIKHPSTAKHAGNTTQPTTTNQAPVAGSTNVSTNANNNQTPVNTNDADDSYASFNGSFYSNDNGNVNQGTANATDHNGLINAQAYLNGKPIVLNQNTINKLKNKWDTFNKDFDEESQQITKFDQQLDQDVQNEIQSTFANVNNSY